MSYYSFWINGLILAVNTPLNTMVEAQIVTDHGNYLTIDLFEKMEIQSKEMTSFK
jgi:hypothetical protein